MLLLFDHPSLRATVTEDILGDCTWRVIDGDKTLFSSVCQQAEEAITAACASLSNLIRGHHHGYSINETVDQIELLLLDGSGVRKRFVCKQDRPPEQMHQRIAAWLETGRVENQDRLAEAILLRDILMGRRPIPEGFEPPKGAHFLVDLEQEIKRRGGR